MKYLLLILCFFTQISFAYSLSQAEKNICVYIQKEKESQIKLLARLVNINTGTTSNIKGIKKVGNILRAEFKKLKFKTTWVNEPSEMKRAPTLIATRKGKQGKKILMIGHLDTVFAKDNPFQKFKRFTKTAKGPGVTDDKGGIVVLLYALKALNNVHALSNATITIVLTGDEEDSGKPSSSSRKPLIEAAKNMDVALDFEPTITLESGTIARRGVTNWKIETHGNQAHSATIFKKDVGDGAIFELARILNDMRTKLAGEKQLSFNPGLVVGGTQINDNPVATSAKVFGKQNVVAKSAIAIGDFRFLTHAQKETFEKNLIEIVSQHLPYTKAEVTFQDGIPAMQPTEDNLDLLTKYSQVSEDLGMKKVIPLNAGLRGAGDISHVAAIVRANMAGLGPLGFGAHTGIESIDLNSLTIQTKRAAVLMYRLLQ